MPARVAAGRLAPTARFGLSWDWTGLGAIRVVDARQVPSRSLQMGAAVVVHGVPTPGVPMVGSSGRTTAGHSTQSGNLVVAAQRATTTTAARKHPEAAVPMKALLAFFC